MLKTFFARHAFEQFLIGLPSLRPASADVISPVVFDAAISIFTIGKHRAAIAFERRGNCFDCRIGICLGGGDGRRQAQYKKNEYDFFHNLS